MPYEPGIQYHGDQYIAAGINKLGDLFSGAIDKTEDLRKRAALNDAVVSHALNNNRISQDEYNKYIEAPWGKKEGIANGIMANMHDDWQRQQFDAEEKDKALQRALSLQIAQIAHADNGAADSYEAGPEQFAQAKAAGGSLVQTAKGHYQFVPSGGPDGASEIVTQPLKVGDREVPGKAVVTKGGSNAFQIIDTLQTAPGSVISGPGIPENTFVAGAKGNPIKLDKTTTRRLNNAAAGPAPTPAPSYMQRFLPSFLGGAPAATPQPDPTPSQTPAVPSVVAPAPAATATDKVKVLNPDGKPFMIPRGRLQDYINAGWTAG